MRSAVASQRNKENETGDLAILPKVQFVSCLLRADTEAVNVNEDERRDNREKDAVDEKGVRRGPEDRCELQASMDETDIEGMNIGEG